MTEPRWVKTGDLEEWLRNTFGLFWARDQDGWEKRIEVVDPDPVCPDIISLICIFSWDLFVSHQQFILFLKLGLLALL